MLEGEPLGKYKFPVGGFRNDLRDTRTKRFPVRGDILRTIPVPSLHR